MEPAKQRTGPRRPTRVALLFVALLAIVVLGNYLFAISAPPLARAVELLERDARVTDVVGSPAKVSLRTTRRLRRNILTAFRGEDLVSVLSTIEGPNGKATFRLDASNIDGQGWAGTFAVESSGRSVLKNGNYVTEGTGTIVEGDFAKDGTPRVKKH